MVKVSFSVFNWKKQAAHFHIFNGGGDANWLPAELEKEQRDQ
jgi:hypothetical protein